MVDTGADRGSKERLVLKLRRWSSEMTASGISRATANLASDCTVVGAARIVGAAMRGSKAKAKEGRML
jgi:hypothetical protein